MGTGANIRWGLPAHRAPGLPVALLAHARGPMGCPRRALDQRPAAVLPSWGLGSRASGRQPRPPGTLRVPRDSRSAPWPPWPPRPPPSEGRRAHLTTRLESLSSSLSAGHPWEPQFLDLRNGENGTQSQAGFKPRRSGRAQETRPAPRRAGGTAAVAGAGA